MCAQVTFDDILERIGSGGRWQLAVFLWTLIGGIFTGMHHMGGVFLGGTPEHRCAIPGWRMGTSDKELQQWIPWDNSTGKWSRCQRFAEPAPGDQQQLVSCTDWVYSRDQYMLTIVNQWDLVCDRRWLLSTAQSLYMFGIFIGSIANGAISDQFGRKRVICISSMVFMVCSVAAAFSSSYTVFVLLRFATAMSLTGAFECAFVLCVEIMGPRWRTVFGVCYDIQFAIGVMILSGDAYMLRYWRELQLSISVPSVAMLLYWWVLPESPRWLILNDRLQDALQVLKFAARRNQRELPEDEQLLQLMKDFRQTELILSAEVETEEKAIQTSCMHGLMRVKRLMDTPKLRRISSASFYNWMVLGMVYYGISFDSVQLSSNPYLPTFLAGVVEVLACLIAVPLITKMGRRIILIAFHLTLTTSILAILAIPANISWPKLVLGMIGKLAASANFGIIFIYTAEFYPTTLRNVGLGASSSSARIGSMAAPYIVDLLNPVHWSLPSLVFGVFAISAAAVALLLPETNARPLPETVNNVEEGKWEAAQRRTSIELN